jgi:hypothetical protein
MVTASPATLLLLARTADEQRERIIRDIHDGTLCSEVPVEPDVRAALTPWLSSQPEAAKRLGRMAEMNGRLYPRDYWRLGFVAHWTGGTMGLYRSQFPKYFGDTPTRDIGLLASEGRMSIPVSDGTAAGLLAVNNQFFEFIPAREYGAGQPRVLRVHEVEIGREYFLVVTNDSGLIRYDLGDRVRVTGREGQTPLIEFLSRDAHTSSLAGEKLTEHQVVDAMERLCADCDETIVDFVLAPRWDETPGYRLYVEQSAMSGISKLAERLDAFLCDVNFEYCTRRDSGRLQPIELALLPGGCLAERDRRIRQLRARTSEQFKHQYLLSSPGQDAELEALIMNCASNPHHATRRAETVPATSISDRIVNG